MSEFTVRGQFQSRDGAQSFSRTVEAENENVAEEYVFSRFGAEHNLTRAEIDIEEVARA